MLGKTEGKRRRQWQKMRRLDGVIDSTDMNLSQLREIVEKRDGVQPRRSQRIGHGLVTEQQQQGGDKAESQMEGSGAFRAEGRRRTPAWKTRSGGKGLCDELSEGMDPHHQKRRFATKVLGKESGASDTMWEDGVRRRNLVPSGSGNEQNQLRIFPCSGTTAFPKLIKASKLSKTHLKNTISREQH